MKKDVELLKEWFVAEKRDLPWRMSPSPYAVWVSEVMLQQTQVAVVLPYFLRWMERFPTVSTLASASQEEVVKLWEGLGYYSRARNLHSGACEVMTRFGGKLPDTPEGLASIKGIGPYTVGAILSFAFHKKAAVVDGNVARVLARYYGIEEEIDKASTMKRLRELAYEFLPDEEPWVASEALIELGATLCKRTAECERCPLQKGCYACKEGYTDELPNRTPRASTIFLHRAVPLIRSGEHFLVRQCSEGEVMAGLYEFPYLETTVEEKKMRQLIEDSHQTPLTHIASLPSVQHTFTRYRVTLYPHLFESDECFSHSKYSWILQKALTELPFSSGHRRVLKHLLQSQSESTTIDQDK